MIRFRPDLSTLVLERFRPFARTVAVKQRRALLLAVSPRRWKCRVSVARVRPVPELPDITVYVEAIERVVAGSMLEDFRVHHPFLLRSVTPEPRDLVGRPLKSVSRLGKRVVFEFADERFAVIHLMIAGRFRWSKAPSKANKQWLATMNFGSGALVLTEAGKKRRASLHLVSGRDHLVQFDRGGLEVLEAGRERFAERIVLENRTLKRALTDPRLFSGIGNAYSDEILHAAKLSPVMRTQSLDANQISELYDAVRRVLQEWTDKLRLEAGDAFPTKVTAFRSGMAVHGRYGEACPRCDHGRSAHSLRGQRIELLSALSNER